MTFKNSLWWLNGIFRLGYKRNLEDIDIYHVLPEDTSIKLSNDLRREWEKELYKWKLGGQPNLQKALFRSYNVWIAFVGLAFLIVESLRVTQAVLLCYIVSYWEEDSTLTPRDAFLYCTGWTASYIFTIIFDNIAFHKTFYCGLKMKVAITSIIYRKTLKLSQLSLHDTSSTIGSLLSTDTQRFDQICLAVNYVWLGPVQCVAVVVILWRYLNLGSICLIAIACILLLVPVQYCIGKRLANFRVKMSELAEQRVRVMNDIINGIKTIKIFCWEKPFTSLINNTRRFEFTYIKNICHTRGLNSAIYIASGKILILGVFMVYSALGHLASASIIFSTLALLDLLRGNICLLGPWGVQYITEAREALDRVQEFLLLEERNSLEGDPSVHVDKDSSSQKAAIRFEKYSASWTKDEASLALRDINTSVYKGEFAIVTGPTGSGKSSLLCAAMGEMPKSGGLVRTSSEQMAFVSQQLWINTATVRDNILFGETMDRRKYNKVLYACCLIDDLDQLEKGDATMVGERGTILSVAQKAKICVARAMYRDPDVYMFDDVLVHLDEVELKHIFNKGFCGLISTKTVIIVSNELQFIKAADQVIVMNKGTVIHAGTYSDIVQKGYKFDYIKQNADIIGGALSPEIITKTRQPGSSAKKSGLTKWNSEDSLDNIWLDTDTSSSSDFTDEDKPRTKVHHTIYKKYFTIGGGTAGLTVFTILCLFSQVSYMLCDWWLYHWLSTKQSENRSSNVTSLYNVSITQSPLDTFHDIFIHSADTSLPQSQIDMYIYLVLVMVLCVFVFIRAVTFSTITAKTSKSLHETLFASVIRARLEFFESKAPGKVLCRFSRDTSFLDDTLPASIYDCVQGSQKDWSHLKSQFLSLVIGCVIMCIAANYWLCIAVVPFAILLAYIRHHYINTISRIRKAEISAKTPIFQHISSTLEGMRTIRSCRCEERFLRTYDSLQDNYTAAGYLHLAVNRWFSIKADLINIMMVALLPFVSVISFSNVSPGLLGMALAYTFSYINLLHCTIRQSAEIEMQMAGVEKILKYSQTPSEGDVITSSRPSVGWPHYGILTLEGVTVFHPESSCVLLENVWCCIRAEEKVGIYCTNPATHSVIMNVILRLTEPQGTIRIDGLDICQMGLNDLRERISVIPKDVVLFSGSMRRNLDPFTKYSDAHIWKTLEIVRLKQKVESFPGKLYAEMWDYGDSFSFDEKQLICVARALLRNSKVLLVEEAPISDRKRQNSILVQVIRDRFKHCTVVTFTKNFHTLMDTDRLMLVQDAKITEFDPPHTLLENDSAMSKMVCRLPEDERTVLAKIAKDRFENRPYVAPPHCESTETVSVGRNGGKSFTPSFHSVRLNGVLNNFTGNRVSTNRF